MASSNTGTSLGLPYWTLGNDIILPITWAWQAWPPITPQRLLIFNAMMLDLDLSTRSTSKFICSTLVWRAYLRGTAGTVDLSNPNNMIAEPGSFFRGYT